jgi:hypothetical protein
MRAPKYFIAVGSDYYVCMDVNGLMLYVRPRRSKPIEWAWSASMLSPRLKSITRRVLSEYFAVNV